MYSAVETAREAYDKAELDRITREAEKEAKKRR
jgi:hypothetical protein